MAAGIVAAACACGTRAFGRRAGLIAAATVAVTAPFLYYAKTANVDVPCTVLVGAVDAVLSPASRNGTAAARLPPLRVGDALGHQGSGVGLYLLAPFVIVWHLWRLNRDAGMPRAAPIADRSPDRRGRGHSLALCDLHNLLFNPGGFMDHVRSSRDRAAVVSGLSAHDSRAPGAVARRSG